MNPLDNNNEADYEALSAEWESAQARELQRIQDEQHELAEEYEAKSIAIERVKQLRKQLRGENFPWITVQDFLNLPHSSPKPVINRIIYPGSVTLIAGDPKVGKSTFLFNALLASQEAKTFLGLETRPVKVGYISEQPYQSLYKQLSETPGIRQYVEKNIQLIPFDNNIVLNPEGEDRSPSSWLEQVRLWQAAIDKWTPDLLVLDTYSSFAQLEGGELYDSGPIIRKLQQLKSLVIKAPDIAIVILHHLRKEKNLQGFSPVKSFHDIAGSYGFRAATDVNVLLIKPEKDDKSPIRRVDIEGRYESDEDKPIFTAVRLKVEENQLVDVFGEIGFHIDGLKGA